MLGLVVERRIQQLFRHEYMKQSVTMNEILPASVIQTHLRSYLIERTLRRPRDIIAFVNRILVENEGEGLPLSSRGVTKSEASYSDGRRKALEDEWRSCHPLVASYLQVVHGVAGSKVIDAINEDRLFSLVYEVSNLNRPPVDEVERMALAVYDRDKELRFKRLARVLLSCLYKTGAVGVKLHPSQPYTFCYEQRASIGEGELPDDAKFTVHPMLVTALGCRPEKDAA